MSQEKVTALIKVNMSPEISEGYNRVAHRISQYDNVESLYLVTGSQDLLVTVTMDSVNEIGNFVSEHLAPIAGVLDTETHFILKKYKEHGRVLIKNPDPEERISFV